MLGGMNQPSQYFIALFRTIHAPFEFNSVIA
jgi:hypothetical protein